MPQEPALSLQSPHFSQKRSPRGRDLAHSHRQRGEGLPPTTRTGGGCKLVGWGWLLCRRSFWRGASALWLDPSHLLGLQVGAAAKAGASNAESGRHQNQTDLHFGARSSPSFERNPFRCLQNKRSSCVQGAEDLLRPTGYKFSPRQVLRRPPHPPGSTMLRETERVRSCKINALFCPEQHGSSSQHCTTGGAGGARETYAGEKEISGTRADIVCFKDATSVYFASTGPSAASQQNL